MGRIGNAKNPYTRIFYLACKESLLGNLTFEMQRILTQESSKVPTYLCVHVTLVMCKVIKNLSWAMWVPLLSVKPFMSSFTKRRCLHSWKNVNTTHVFHHHFICLHVAFQCHVTFQNFTPTESEFFIKYSPACIAHENQFEIQGLAMLVYCIITVILISLMVLLNLQFSTLNLYTIIILPIAVITNVVFVIVSSVALLLHVVSISAYFPGSQSAQEAISSQQVEPPPPISLEDLQGEARIVANRVLSRPQSGMVFMEDVKSAIAMWADRLTNLLGPPKQGTVQVVASIIFSNLRA